MKNVILLALVFLLVQCDDDEKNIPLEFEVGATSTFLRVDNFDPATDPTIIDLDAHEISAGTTLTLKTKGSYYNTTALTERNSMVCVFSETMVILNKTTLDRVREAIDAGTDYVTENTFAGDQTTDIPEDFKVDEDEVQVVVPNQAEYLIVGNNDSKQEDNSVTPEGFYLVVEF